MAALYHGVVRRAAATGAARQATPTIGDRRAPVYHQQVGIL
jgi:hypothetical protein